MPESNDWRKDYLNYYRGLIQIKPTVGFLAATGITIGTVIGCVVQGAQAVGEMATAAVPKDIRDGYFVGYQGHKIRVEQKQKMEAGMRLLAQEIVHAGEGRAEEVVPAYQT